MLAQLDGLTLELVPHCASVRPEGWTGDHAVRPLTEVGHRQARELAAAIGTDIDAIYLSPALRCLQTVKPLEEATGLTTVRLPELLDTARFAEPLAWTRGVYEHIAQSVGGGWAAGHGLRALTTMASGHPRGRVVAASHGDIIPAFLAMLCAAFDMPLPDVIGWGGWYTVRFAGDSFQVVTHPPVRSSA